MEESQIPNSSGKNAKTIQNYSHKSWLMKTATKLLDALKSGCVCTCFDENSSKKTKQIFGTFVHDGLKLCDDLNNWDTNSDNILAFLTLIRTVVKSAIHPTLYSSPGEVGDKFCKGLWEWQVILRRMKFKILSSIIIVWKVGFKHEHLHLKGEAETAFAHVLFLLPCPVRCSEQCGKTCCKVMHNLTLLKEKINPGFVIRLLHIMFCELDEEPDVKTQKQIVNANRIGCAKANVFVKVW